MVLSGRWLASMSYRSCDCDMADVFLDSAKNKPPPGLGEHHCPAWSLAQSWIAPVAQEMCHETNFTIWSSFDRSSSRGPWCCLVAAGTASEGAAEPIRYGLPVSYAIAGYQISPASAAKVWRRHQPQRHPVAALVAPDGGPPKGAPCPSVTHLTL